MLDLIQDCLSSSSVLSPLRTGGYEIHLVALDRGIQIQAQRGADQIHCFLDAPMWWVRIEPAQARILSQHIALLLNEAWAVRMEA